MGKNIPGKRMVMALSCLVGLSACAIKQDVRRAGALTEREICVTQNAAVRKTFEESLNKSLRSQGYVVKSVPADSAVTVCPVTITYTASWRWDLALYMAYAEIRVFNAGREEGRAIYDSTRGGGNMGKFIDAEKKVDELVRELVPRL
jgi:hypothetical protein